MRRKWTADNLKNALVINIMLAIFNMMPIPPLDGGQVAVGLLPQPLAYPAFPAGALRHADPDRAADPAAVGRRRSSA